VDERFDLSRWRLAGNGADMIRPDVMQGFVNAFAPAGFKASAFLPSYGLAEATLSVTIMPPGEGIRVELVEEERLSGTARDLTRPARYRAIVNCGKPVKDMVVEIRDGAGRALADHTSARCGARAPASCTPISAIRVDRCLPGRRLAGHRRHGLQCGRLPVHRGPRQGHDHHQRQEPLAQDIEWAVEQLPGFHQGDIAAFSLETETGEETAAVLVHCRVSDPVERQAEDGRGREECARSWAIRRWSSWCRRAAAHLLGQAEPRQGQEALLSGEIEPLLAA
jgi:fatty-acyl-CoA synthase